MLQGVKNGAAKKRPVAWVLAEGDDDDMALEESSEEARELAGESPLVEAPVPLTVQLREITRLASDESERPDEEMRLALMRLEDDTEADIADFDDDDDEVDGPAADEKLVVRQRRRDRGRGG